MTKKEYIEREKVLELIDCWNREEQCCNVIDYIAGWNEAIEQLRCNICEDIPTADVAPVKHGYWKPIYLNKMLEHQNRAKYYRCSVCGRDSSDEIYSSGLDYEFCPNCGAKMSEKEGI